jgi:hypothetical protein
LAERSPLGIPSEELPVSDLPSRRHRRGSLLSSR